MCRASGLAVYLKFDEYNYIPRNWKESAINPISEYQ